MSNNKYENKEATRELKAKFGGNVKLPSDVQFVIENNEKECCRIKLNPQKVHTENMQTNANAFEAWAVALYIALNENGIIILDVDGEFTPMEYEKNGHWGRFLYRALRFSEQYEWLILSDKIEVQVNKFKEYLDSNIFTNNLAEGEAGVKEEHNNENVVESIFAENEAVQKKFDFFAENKVYRQLPVGLFRCEGETYKYSKDRMTFTGGKSAIDLWTWNGDEFRVIELKTKNVMMGIITEIFFYANYMYDFLIRKDGKFILHEPSSILEKDRGYSDIYNHREDFKKICGIMLADEYHRILKDDRVLRVLNEGRLKDGMSYVKAEYPYALFRERN